MLPISLGLQLPFLLELASLKMKTDFICLEKDLLILCVFCPHV